VRRAALRSVFGALALGVATLLHVAAGGGALFVPGRLFVGAATVLGLLLGPVAVFEQRAARGAPSLREDLLAAGLSGWAIFVALCVGWVQARYAKELFAATDADAAVQDALQGFLWITEDPGWTLRYFGWIVVPAAAAVWGRLRGWPLDRQVAFALGASGAVWGAFPYDTPAVTFGLATVAIALPVVAAASGLRRAPADPEAEPSAPWALPWRLGVALVLVTAFGLVGREAWRARRRVELAADAARDLERWEQVGRDDAAFPGSVAALSSDVAAVESDLAVAATPDAARALRPRLEAALGRADALLAWSTGEPRVEAELDALVRDMRRNGLGGAESAACGREAQLVNELQQRQGDRATASAQLATLRQALEAAAAKLPP
jgi:hypothetical protein